jgi:hypothetical protein
MTQIGPNRQDKKHAVLTRTLLKVRANSIEAMKREKRLRKDSYPPPKLPLGEPRHWAYRWRKPGRANYENSLTAGDSWTENRKAKDEGDDTEHPFSNRFSEARSWLISCVFRETGVLLLNRWMRRP